jgi:hypothetical protein
MHYYERLEWEQRVLASLSAERLQEHYPQGCALESAYEGPDGSVWVRVFDHGQARVEYVSLELLE